MIYFIKQLDYIKIGFTNNFKKRLHALQVSSPVKLVVMGLIDGDLSTEGFYHDKFREYHSCGEWFHYNQVISEYVDRLPTGLMWKYGFKQHDRISPLGLIKECRINGNLSLTELAEKIGVTKQSIAEMEIREIQGTITLNSIIKTLEVMGYKFETRAVKKVIP
ncbi:MAG: GIY-YIG nuclease family protein [Janthinobacterium sp.]|jgi:DNA-binding XRE family transcriptional regulator